MSLGSASGTVADNEPLVPTLTNELKSAGMDAAKVERFGEAFLDVLSEV